MSGFLLTLGIAIYKHFHNKEVIIKQFKNKEGLTVKNFFNFIFMRSQFFFKKEKKISPKDIFSPSLLMRSVLFLDVRP